MAARMARGHKMSREKTKAFQQQVREYLITTSTNGQQLSMAAGMNRSTWVNSASISEQVYDRTAANFKTAMALHPDGLESHRTIKVTNLTDEQVARMHKARDEMGKDIERRRQEALDRREDYVRSCLIQEDAPAHYFGNMIPVEQMAL